MARTRGEIVTWIVCIGLAIANIAILLAPRPPVPVNTTEVPDKRLSPAEREVEVQEQLEAVSPFDRELSAKFDLSPEEIEKAPTAKLLNHFSTSGMRVWLGLYDEADIGVRRAIRGSTTLAAFVKRPDMMDGFIQWNKQYIEEIRNLTPESTTGGELSSHLVASDDLLKFRGIFQRAKGRERELLGVLCERYRAMVEANALFDEEHKPFGASFNALLLIIKELAREIDPTGPWDESDEPTLVARAEALVPASE